MRGGSSSGLPLVRGVPLGKSVHLPKAQFLHLKNGMVITVLGVFVRITRHNRQIVPPNLTFSICTMEIISTAQNCFEIVYRKAPGTNRGSTNVLAFDSFGSTHPLPTHAPIKSAPIVLSPNKVSEYFQMQEGNYTCQL